MEAGNNDDRVRPIPLEGDDALQTETPAERAVIERTSRPWLPLSIAVAAVVVVVGSVSIFGALRFDDPEPSDPGLFSANTTDDEGSTTTASTLPPPLEELLPGITDRLTLVAESAEDDSAWTLLWDPTFRVPKAVELGIESTPQSRLVAARFDSSGRQVAVQKCGDLACDLFVGLPTDVGAQADVVDTVGFAWHAAEIGRLAWVEAAPSGRYRLVTGTANPLSKEVDEVTVRFELDEPFRIVRWDARGFVIGYFIDDVATAGVALDGTLQWAIDGAASTATDELVAAVTADAGWIIVDRSSGEPVDAPATVEELVFVAGAETSDLVARLARRDAGYSLTVGGGSLRAPRVITIEEQYRPLGFTADATYFLFLSGEERVIFVDWNTGAARAVDAPEGYRIIGIDVG